MKLSTRKVVGIELGVVLLWLSCLVIPSVWIREYVQIGVLGIALLASMWLLGWAKIRPNKIATMFMIVVALLFEVFWFVFFGLKLGFLRNVYTWGWNSLLVVFLPVILMLVGVEILRGQMIAKGHESKLVLVLTVVVFTMFSIIWSWSMYDLSQAKDVFELIMLTGVLGLMTNTALTYVAYQYDYRANICFRLIMELPILILPIIPNVSNYLTVMFQTALVMILMVVLVRMHAQGWTGNEYVQVKVKTDTQLGWQKWIKYGVSGVAVLSLVIYVALMSGIFKYHFLAVGSGSMEPTLSRGDLILVEKSDHYDEMVEGEILVYRRNNVVMVHRIDEVEEAGGMYYFQTKGDANVAKDNWIVNQSDVIGLAKGRIIAMGYPTLWLNELFNGGSF